VNHYLATDQEYVRRLFRTNLEENASVNSTALSTKQKGTKSRGAKPAKKQPSSSANNGPRNVTFTTLDWELDQPELLKACIGAEAGGQDAEDEAEEDKGFDLILSCDCIYNDALVTPFVRTCTEICRLRPVYEPFDESESSPSARQPTICIVAQQQRAPDVFEAWLRETLREFRVWRLSDDVLVDGLKNGSGYLVHLLLAREKH
jgi:hypothetical protein